MHPGEDAPPAQGHQPVAKVPHAGAQARGSQPNAEAPLAGNEGDDGNIASFADLAVLVASATNRPPPPKAGSDPSRWLAWERARREREAPSETEGGTWKNAVIQDVVLGRSAIMSGAVESAFCGIREKKLHSEKVRFAEELRAVVLCGFKAFLSLLLSALGLTLMVVGAITYELWDDTPVRCQVENLDGRGVAHVLQYWLTFQLVMKIQLPNDPQWRAIYIRGRIPTFLCPLETTSAEVLQEGLKRIAGELINIFDDFVIQAERKQKKQIWKGRGYIRDDAGSNERKVKKDKEQEPERHQIDIKCHMHALHKVLLGLLALLPGLVRRLCRAGGSLKLHGALKKLRDEAEKYFKKKLKPRFGEAASFVNQNYREGFFDIAFGRKDNPHVQLREKERRVYLEAMATGDIQNGSLEFVSELYIRQEVMDEYIKKRIVPSVVTGMHGAWNISRWTRNMDLLRFLLKMSFCVMFAFAYPLATQPA